MEDSLQSISPLAERGSLESLGIKRPNQISIAVVLSIGSSGALMVAWYGRTVVRRADCRNHTKMTLKTGSAAPKAGIQQSCMC